MIQLLAPVVLDVDRQFHTAVDLRSLEGVDVTGFSSYTVVVKIRRQENLVGGSRIRVVLRGPNNASGSVSAVYYGETAGSGNAYDFSATPTQVTFGGAGSLTLAAKGTYTSDPITIDFNPAKSHAIAMNVSSSSLRRLTAPAGERGVVSYYKSATSEAGTAAKASGYTAQADTAYSVYLIKASRTLDETPL